MFRRLLLPWAKRNFRDFWWRKERDLYPVAVVEILLKQTKAEMVHDLSRHFLDQYATPAALAEADRQEIEAFIRPLGLYRQRASQLSALGHHMASPAFAETKMPDGVSKMPGIGAYSAAAIQSCVYGEKVPAIDVNVARIVMRVFDLVLERGEPRKDKRVKEVADQLLDGPNPRLLNWGLLDLGATVCTSKNPRCDRCPLRTECAYAQATTPRNDDALPS
jgi:A/G-specific adenine glycosylase